MRKAINAISIPFFHQAEPPAPIWIADECGWIMPGHQCAVIGHEYPVTVLRKSILPEFVFIQ